MTKTIGIGAVAVVLGLAGAAWAGPVSSTPGASQPPTFSCTMEKPSSSKVGDAKVTLKLKSGALPPDTALDVYSGVATGGLHPANSEMESVCTSWFNGKTYSHSWTNATLGQPGHAITNWNCNVVVTSNTHCSPH